MEGKTMGEIKKGLEKTIKQTKGTSSSLKEILKKLHGLKKGKGKKK